MIISVDTEKMNTMATMAQNINTNIDDAVVALVPVVEHNDWNCKERDQINEGIVAVKNYVRGLQETIDAFSSQVRQIAMLFDAFEAGIPNKYQHLDALLGSAFSVECPVQSNNVTPGGVTSEVVDAMSSGIRVDGGLENNALGNLSNPIQLCNFSDVDFSNAE